MRVETPVPRHFFSRIDFTFTEIWEVYTVNDCFWMNATRQPNKAQLSRSVTGCFQDGGQKGPSLNESWALQGLDDLSKNHYYVHLLRWEMNKPGDVKRLRCLSLESKSNLDTLPWVLQSFTVARWTHADLNLEKSPHLSTRLLSGVHRKSLRDPFL